MNSAAAPALGPPLGRLFWKFFAACWLALLLASALVGGLLWLDARTSAPGAHALDEGPLGRLLVDAAAAVAEHGGRDALIAWLGQAPAAESRPRPPVFAVDADGNDLLDRTVPADALAAARAGPAVGGQGPPDEQRSARREVMLPDGPMLLFVPAPPVRVLPTLPEPGLRGPPGPRLPRWLPPLVTGVVASLLLAALLAWYFARPIRALDAAFKRAADGDLAVRVAPRIGRRRDEVADLGREFDRMVQRIDGLLQAQRRLLHDVSHELRSPLARLQVCVGLARRDPAQAARMLDRVEHETGQMDRLVEEILTLARLESGAADADRREAVDLAALVKAAVDDARIEAQARNATIALDGAAGGTLHGQAALLRRAIDNVLRNAIQHAPPGSPIEVTIERASEDRWVLRIADRGPGLSADECESIFQPFVRGRQRRGEGFGLGLAIALRAVEAHQGRIEAAPREGGGLVVTLTFPRNARA